MSDDDFDDEELDALKDAVDDSESDGEFDVDKLDELEKVLEDVPLTTTTTNDAGDDQEDDEIYEAALASVSNTVDEENLDDDSVDDNDIIAHEFNTVGQMPNIEKIDTNALSSKGNNLVDDCLQIIIRAKEENNTSLKYYKGKKFDGDEFWNDTMTSLEIMTEILSPFNPNTSEAYYSKEEVPYIFDLLHDMLTFLIIPKWMRVKSADYAASVPEFTNIEYRYNGDDVSYGDTEQRLLDGIELTRYIRQNVICAKNRNELLDNFQLGYYLSYTPNSTNISKIYHYWYRLFYCFFRDYIHRFYKDSVTGKKKTSTTRTIATNIYAYLLVIGPYRLSYANLLHFSLGCHYRKISGESFKSRTMFVIPDLSITFAKNDIKNSKFVQRYQKSLKFEDIIKDANIDTKHYEGTFEEFAKVTGRICEPCKHFAKTKWTEGPLLMKTRTTRVITKDGKNSKGNAVYAALLHGYGNELVSFQLYPYYTVPIKKIFRLTELYDKKSNNYDLDRRKLLEYLTPISRKRVLSNKKVNDVFTQSSIDLRAILEEHGLF